MSALNSSSLDLRSVALGGARSSGGRRPRRCFPASKSRRCLRTRPAARSRAASSGAGRSGASCRRRLRVDYEPVAWRAARTQACSRSCFNCEGATSVTSTYERRMLRANDLCLLDGRDAFQSRSHRCGSQVMFLRIPRELVLVRYPYLELAQRRLSSGTSRAPASCDLCCSACLSRQGCSRTSSARGARQCRDAAGVPKAASSALADDLHWRARSALSSSMRTWRIRCWMLLAWRRSRDQ